MVNWRSNMRYFCIKLIFEWNVFNLGNNHHSSLFRCRYRQERKFNLDFANVVAVVLDMLVLLAGFQLYNNTEI